MFKDAHSRITKYGVPDLRYDLKCRYFADERRLSARKTRGTPAPTSANRPIDAKKAAAKPPRKVQKLAFEMNRSTFPARKELAAASATCGQPIAKA